MRQMVVESEFLSEKCNCATGVPATLTGRIPNQKEPCKAENRPDPRGGTTARRLDGLDSHDLSWPGQIHSGNGRLRDFHRAAPTKSNARHFRRASPARPSPGEFHSRIFAPTSRASSVRFGTSFVSRAKGGGVVDSMRLLRADGPGKRYGPERGGRYCAPYGYFRDDRIVNSDKI